ncbi:alpha/beta fold hydrolase [Streptomyces violaceusniger]|uniref:Alpha/beta hydrolase fold containing protein n=1 Tax=Streptomyces violaceusniger (strain Tu 4113) TaxID=653045 RepID=G2P3L9_STRV4|nr:alpha/beta hydrolase [Streptomyces violaceusniger]AEM84354.1 alpha/beta hydrolase fold containing protein [Streptomyces violaceusniger Tu 4113]
MPKTNNGIHYEERGNGPDAIVLLPGLGCSLKCWSEVAPLLDGYRLVLMDLPGHAGSIHAPADGSSLARIAETVIDACDQLGLERFALVGLSFGGALSVRIALNRPGQVCAVMALMPWNAGGTEAGDPVIEGFYKSFRDVEAITQAIGAISLEPSKTTDVVRTMTSAVTEQFWRSWLGTGGGAYTSMFEELSGIAVPACYVIGGRDTIAPQDKLIADVRAMPGGRLVFLSDAGHLAPYESPELVAREIREFVSRYANTPSPGAGSAPRSSTSARPIR